MTQFFKQIYLKYFDKPLPLEEIPDGPFFEILKYLSPEQVHRMRRISKTFKSRIDSCLDSYWQYFFRGYQDSYETLKQVYISQCKVAKEIQDILPTSGDGLHKEFFLQAEDLENKFSSLPTSEDKFYKESIVDSEDLENTFL